LLVTGHKRKYRSHRKQHRGNGNHTIVARHCALRDFAADPLKKSEVMKTLGKFAPNACVAVPGKENAPRLATRSIAKSTDYLFRL
jgi:hypothetical protein